jgi:microcystin-dependent protein
MSAKSTDGFNGFPIPVGTIFSYAGSVDDEKFPQGYLICDGGEYEQADYPELFRVIGATYGAPSSPDLFKVPDFVGIYARHATTAGVIENKTGTASFDPVALTPANLPTFGGISFTANVNGNYPTGSSSSSTENTENGLFPDSYPMTTWNRTETVNLTSNSAPVFNYENGTGTVADLVIASSISNFEVQSLEIVFIIKAEYGTFNI